MTCGRQIKYRLKVQKQQKQKQKEKQKQQQEVLPKLSQKLNNAAQQEKNALKPAATTDVVIMTSSSSLLSSLNRKDTYNTTNKRNHKNNTNTNTSNNKNNLIATDIKMLHKSKQTTVSSLLSSSSSSSSTSSPMSSFSFIHSSLPVAERCIDAKECVATDTVRATPTNCRLAPQSIQQQQQQWQQQKPKGYAKKPRSSSPSSTILYSSNGLPKRYGCILHAFLFSILCMSSTHFQSASANGLLSKHEPMFISRSETFKFVAGETIVLPCEVANTDPYVVAWKRGIAILTAGSVKVTPDPRVRLVNGFNLQIRDAVPQDAGDYICQIATMEPREITHTVEILVPPRIHHISTGGHLQVKKGSSVRIECSASGNPTPNVTWSRKNNILPNGEEKLHSHVLSIENVDRHKGGVYICTANNGVGQAASSQVVLHVLYPPEISVERPVVFSGEGHEAMLVCIVHGETQPEVIWFKDTMQLDTTERHIMENRGSRHTLIIRKVHPQDFGNYSCVAENQLGKSRKTLQLSGKPNVAAFNSPPISQYKDKYNISWTVDSHTPIEEYKLSFRRLPQGHEVVDNAIDSAQQSSTGLSPSSSMQMYGGGGSGIGLHNHRIGSVGSVGSSSSGMGNYGGYGNLMHWGRNDWRDVVLPALAAGHHYTQGMSYMIRGLDPDQHYEATVQARNRYGWSEPTHSFIFSTSSNDGLVDLSTFLNHGSSDNEMRDLSVTFYGGNSASQQYQYEMNLALMGCVAFLLIKLTPMMMISGAG